MLVSIDTMLRTHTCGELRKVDDNKQVVLCGWVDSFKNQKEMGFLNLRDKYGITQVFLNKDLISKFEDIRKESVVKVTGKVKVRPKPNEKISTGEIEVEATDIEILNESLPLPLELDDPNTTEETRLKYRYLDLRTDRMQNNLVIRHKLCKAIRDFLDGAGFLEIETPMLAKSTPEGARDFLVPSRVHQAKFYALPQSPQLFKQLFMVSGFDKYFQIVKCFRDEDLRADRQLEFTQLDVEMSFIEQDDLFDIMERMFKFVWKQVLNIDIKIPFERRRYEEVMREFKTDKPDLRKNLGDKSEYKFLWVTDFPLMEYCEEEKRHVAMHHPFTSPKKEDEHFLPHEPGKAHANAYDLVLNGAEIGGGSIRIHKRELQKKMFEALGLTPDEAEQKFGFLLNAFQYGAPPHGGIAFGLDRIAAIMTNNESIREVIAFPKNKDARDLMLNAPSDVSKEQLDELGMKKRRSSC